MPPTWGTSTYSFVSGGGLADHMYRGPTAPLLLATALCVGLAATPARAGEFVAGVKRDTSSFCGVRSRVLGAEGHERIKNRLAERIAAVPGVTLVRQPFEVRVPHTRRSTLTVLRGAHEGVHDGVTSYITEVSPSFIRRASIQFGLYLPQEGPDAPPNQGLGPYLLDLNQKVTSGYVKPTQTIGGEQDATIAGIRFQFASFASDTDDTIVIWLPEKRVAINNHFWPTRGSG